MTRQFSKFLTVIFIAGLTGSLANAREVVHLETEFYQRTILIDISDRALYLIRDEESAIRYDIAVPKKGKSWTGWATVDGKYLRPAWEPPTDVKRDNPKIPDHIPGGHPSNPMGAAALTLDRDEYAIHGVARGKEKTIGTEASYGCIRMSNADILDLYSRVETGTRVFVRN